MSRMYALGVKDSNNFHWNIILSEVHNPNESHLNHLHSNHHLTIHNTLNTKKENGVNSLHQSDLNLNFYTKLIVTFNTHDGKPKRLEVIVLNQSYQPQSSFEHIWKGGASGILSEWRNIFSLAGL